jgi:hypothetical protein
MGISVSFSREKQSMIRSNGGLFFILSCLMMIVARALAVSALSQMALAEESNFLRSVNSAV